MSFEEQQVCDQHADVPANYSAECVQCYLFALLDEANRRGSMFPQEEDEHQRDSEAVHRVCGMVAYYGERGQPNPQQIEALRQMRASNTNNK